MKTFLLLMSALLPSFIRVPLLRLLGWRIGSRVRLGWLSVILAHSAEIADRVHISPFSFLKARELKLAPHVYVGSMTLINTNRLHIGAESRISRFVIVSAGQLNSKSALIIGKRVSVYPFCWIDTTRTVYMDDDVGIGGGTYIFTHGSWQPNIDGFPVAFGDVHIERGVWLPWRIFILPNVTIGAYSTIGAGAVINKSVPPYSLAGGIPAKVIKADGEHVRRLSVEEKIALVRDMLRDGVDKFRYEGFTVTLTESADEIALLVDQTPVLFRRAFDQVPPGAGVLIAWDRLPDELITELEARQIGWFDFTRRRCADSDHRVFEEIRGIFSIYGTRFERTAAGDALRLPDVEVSRLD